MPNIPTEYLNLDMVVKDGVLVEKPVEEPTPEAVPEDEIILVEDPLPNPAEDDGVLYDE